MDKKLTWSPIIPLIGGFPIGCERATGVEPTQVISAEPFKANDALYLNYLAVHGKFPPTVDFQKYPEYIIPVNIVIATPPCAGLSTLGAKKTGIINRADNDVNHWMYDAMAIGVGMAKADVVIIENAPGLTSTIGKPVLERLRNIAESAGYSTVAYRTSTEFHGIPQTRKRTFLFAFKSAFAPILPFIKKESKSFADFIRAIDNTAPHGDEFLVKDGMNDPWWIYLTETYGVEKTKDMMRDHGTVVDAVIRIGDHDKCIEFWEKREDNNRHLHRVTHAKKKYDMGLGIFDASPRLYETKSCTLTGKAFSMMHPDESRTITVREAMALMGMPSDFTLLNSKRDLGKITQNVPVSTATDMASLAVKFINGELPLSNQKHLFIDNLAHQTKIGKPDKKAVVHQFTLDSFM